MAILTRSSHEIKRNPFAFTMEIIKKSVVGDEFKNQDGNFSFQAATIESQNIIVTDQLFYCNLI